MRTYSLRSHLGLLLFLPLGLCGLAQGQQSHYFSVIVKGQGYHPNMIYSVNATTGQIRQSNDRLKNALAPYPGITVQALSLGMDGTDYVNPHGLCIFGLSALGTSALSSPGVPNSAVAMEPPSELQSDFFGVRHVPSVPNTPPAINIKIVEENSGELPVTADQYLALPSLGLAGTTTGSPLASVSPDVVGFDYHLPPREKFIYFTVSDDINVQGLIYTPADILYLDQHNTIQRWRSAADLGINPEDHIDGLSLCLNPPPGVQPCCILSLRNGALTNLSPSGHTVIGADLLLYTTQPPKLSLWREASANGLTVFASMPLPEIDSVVSIDPKRFIPGSQYGYQPNGPTALQFDDIYYTPSNQQLYIGSSNPGWTNEIAPTTSIEWDFDLTPLPTGGSYTLPVPLEAGQKRLLTIHYIEDGEPKSHYETRGIAPQLQDTINDFLVQAASPQLVVLMGSSAACTPLTLPWTVNIDGISQSPPMSPCGVGVFPMPTAAAAPYRVEAQAIDSFGDRSVAVSNVVWPSPAVSTPTDLTIEKVDSQTVRVNWTPAPNTITEVNITGMPLQTPLPPSATGWQPPLLLDTGASGGFRRVTLTAIDGAGRRSLPLRDSFYMGVEQRLKLNRSLPAGSTLPFGPGDLALEDSTATLIAVPRTPGSDFWTLDTISHNMTAVTSHTLLPDGELHGVTSWLQQTTDTAGGLLQNHLIFSAMLGDEPILVVTGPEAPYSIETVISIPLATPPTSVGPIAVEVQSEQLLIVIDGRLHTIPDLAELLTLTSIRPKLVEPLREMDVAGVSCRKAGFYEITVNNDVGALMHTHLLTMTSDHEVFGATELESPTAVHGVVHAHDPLPTVYISTNNSIDVFQMPRIVEVSPHDFGHRSRLYDLDNDGDVFDYDDLVLYGLAWQAWVADPQSTIAWLETYTDPGAWDVHGGGLSFPGDGVITQGDIDALLAVGLEVLGGLLPPNVCVPTHPNWASSASSCP